MAVILAAGAWMPASYAEEAEWQRAKASLGEGEPEGSFFSGSQEEVDARIDNLVLLRIEPEHSYQSYDARGPVSRSSKKFVVYSPDLDQIYGYKITCTASCPGDGCDVSGCRVDQAGNCSECHCTGEACNTECTSTKKTSFAPQQDRE
ncbi:MAG TPA: hypothetical protein VLU25_01085 [Acidobacteriota bacterium]|nr:hypothetical protein [Acidobacteriota bacterium]